MVAAGMGLWELNQDYGEVGHLSRFCVGDGEVPVTLQAKVVVPPERGAAHPGNLFWVCEATALLTDQGWMPASGIAHTKWRVGPAMATLHRGDSVEMYGWLRATQGPQNPGGLDVRHRLGADRIFVELRIPRASGVQVIEAHNGAIGNWLTRFRLLLREKLLEHTARVDPDAANTMVALVLGYRDPSIDDISHAFADAGVAHLLAISGAHIVFISWVVWMLLRLLPMRPRWREPLATVLVLLYVIATPCGPPVMRAAIIVGMVLMSRLLGRPRQYLNMLASAAAAVVILRPADLLDPGFQLTFICTAALLLLAPRLHAALFGRYIERQKLIASLIDCRWSRLRLKMIEGATVLLTANIIGALTASPLVMLHFNQINLYGIITGMIAFPAVAMTMIASLVQLAAEAASTTIAAAIAPWSTAIARGTVWIIEHLASLPGAALGVRSPAAWIAATMYVPLIFWANRKAWGLSKAAVSKTAACALALLAGWYLWTQPVNALCLQVLSVGQGSSIVLTTPAGETWLINAGSRDEPHIAATAISPALRTAGARTIDALFLSKLDAVHAGALGEVLDQFRPKTIVTPDSTGSNGWTLAAETFENARQHRPLNVATAQAGDHIDLGHGGSVTALSPSASETHDDSLMLLCEFNRRRILMVDPASVQSLTLLPLNHIDTRCDAVVILGPERGAADNLLRQRLAETNAETFIWSGRSPWAPKTEPPGTMNTADGCVLLTIDPQANIHAENIHHTSNGS